jgi:signal transduction histidine kinase
VGHTASGLITKIKKFLAVDYINMINLLQFFFFIFSWIVWFSFSADGFIETKIFALVLLGNCAIQHLLLFPKKKFSWVKPLLFINLLLTYWISLEDPTRITFYFYDLFIAQAVIFYPLGFAIRFTAYTSLSCFIGVFANGLPTVYIWRNLISFVLVFLFMLMTVDLYKKRVTLAFSKTLLAEQKSLLEKTNRNLRQSVAALEEMAVLKERNRIAKEIHDNVGHSLTAVIVQVEAAIRLLPVNTKLAQEKMVLAQDQVRKGLEGIRESVRTLSPVEEKKDILAALKKVVADVEKNTGVRVITDYKNITQIPDPIGKAIYNALKEGLTNGIKHGKAKEFLFTLADTGSEIDFKLKDNGVGCDTKNFGFGLSAMKERVEEFGGAFSFVSQIQNGCLIHLVFPSGKTLASGGNSGQNKSAPGRRSAVNDRRAQDHS